MKKIVLLFAIAGLFSLSSCIIYKTHHITDNPIGTKVGIAKGRNILTGQAGVAAAAKKGGITKIGSIDWKLKLSGKSIVVVTGE